MATGLPATWQQPGAESDRFAAPDERVRKELHEHRERFLARLLEGGAQAYLVADLAGTVLHANAAFEQLTGRSPAAGPLHVADLCASSCHEAVGAALDHLRRSGQCPPLEIACRHGDGQEIPVEVVLELCRDEEGVPIGIYAVIADIRERKRSEQALRESEERFRRLYDEAPCGYHAIDPSGVILSVNRAECEMLGYTPEEMIGRPIQDFVVEEQREEMRASIRERILRDESSYAVERTFVTKDGRRLIFAVDNRLVRDERGEVIAIRSAVQDITWRKQVEAALVASERRTRALFEGIEDAVFVHAPDGRILDANPAASRRLGYSHEEFLKLTTRDIDDPTFAVGYEERLKTQLREGHLRCEGRHRTRTGRYLPVDINTSTVQLEDETVILAVIRDITERKALEETRRQFAEAQLKNAWEIEAKNRALTQSEARYRQLTEGCLDAIVVADGTGKVTLFNHAAERIFGYRADEVLGRHLEELLAPELRERVRRDLEQFVQTRRAELVGQTSELQGLRKDGEAFPAELSLSAIESPGCLQFLMAIRDQTERQRMRAMLVQSEKLASIGLLSAGLAHEINNPLAYVANNLAVLERDLGGVLAMMRLLEDAAPALEPALPELAARLRQMSEELDWPYVRDNLGRMLQRTREGVQRVANIVHGLRSIAHTSPPNLEPAHLTDLIQGALEMVQGRLRRSRIEVHCELGATAKILCVPSQIGQVILNLLVNAVQAIEETRRSEGNQLTIRTRQEAEQQVLEIQDNGCGIPPAHLPRLFDPFFTTKPIGEGTGLGLAISHGLITGHGGRIEVDSQIDRGTRFRIFLPWKPVA